MRSPDGVRTQWLIVIWLVSVSVKTRSVVCATEPCSAPIAAVSAAKAVIESGAENAAELVKNAEIAPGVLPEGCPCRQTASRRTSRLVQALKRN